PCVIVDDMIDTAATISKGVQVLAEMGAGPTFVGATHGLFSGKARQLLEEAPIEQVVVTNTVPIPEERTFAKLKVLSIAPLSSSGVRGEKSQSRNTGSGAMRGVSSSCLFVTRYRRIPAGASSLSSRS